MNADTCKDFIKALELYHDYKFTKAARDAYWAELKDYKDEIIILALQASYGKFPSGRIPSINDLKTLLDEISETARAKKKEKELINRHPLSRRSKSRYPMVDESFKILNSLFFTGSEGEKLSARRCVGEMLKLEEKYPGVGWREAQSILTFG